MAGTNGANTNGSAGGNQLPILRIARPTEGADSGPIIGEAEVAAEIARTSRARTAKETSPSLGGESAPPKTTRITKREKAVQSAKSVVMTLNAGAVLAAGPTAAMKKEEHNLIETGMVSLANQYPDKFIAGGNALGPGMLAVGCLMWIGRIIRDKRSAESIAASLPNPLAENWQGQQTAAQQPEWEPNPPAVRVANVGGASLPIETPQPNGAQYEGESDYGWIGRITSMG